MRSRPLSAHGLHKTTRVCTSKEGTANRRPLKAFPVVRRKVEWTSSGYRKMKTRSDGGKARVFSAENLPWEAAIVV